jgi:aryl-phospho-beta-D-glucosidase BglC (GH1 family)
MVTPMQTLTSTIHGRQATADGFLEGGIAQVDFAFEMGYKYGIAVSLDLHAAQGSQNGYDHSAPFVSPSGHGIQ